MTNKVNTPLTGRVMLFPDQLQAIALKESTRVTSNDGALRTAYTTSKGTYMIRGNNETCFVNKDGTIKRFDKDGVAI